nr:SpoIIE family protein phosphatase [bacterium]
MNSLCVDIGYHSLNKWGEQLCGDHVEVITPAEDSTVLVLADGLGSGVKASILSTLTAKIISTMTASNMSLEDCVATIAKTLPICSERGIAYSTFTIIRITGNREAEVIGYDNPRVILLRGGKNTPYPESTLEIEGKTITRSHIALQEGDAFVCTSDGVLHAGVGLSLNLGWDRKDIIAYLERMYDANMTAKTLATVLLDECNSLYGGRPGDDTTVCVLKIRSRKPVNLVMGPPAKPEDDNRMMALFFGKQGEHIVCGGTTAKIAARYLKKSIIMPPLEEHPADPDIPPVSEIEGVDLVTEGVLTFSRVLDYAKDYIGDNQHYIRWSSQSDGASCIARMLFEDATDINFYVGRAMNPAHQKAEMPLQYNIKMRMVEELADCLRTMGKRIKISYF